MRTTFNRFSALALACIVMNEVGTEGADLGGTAAPTPAPKSKRDLLVEKANALATKYNDVLAQIKLIDDKDAAEAKLAGISAGDRVDAQIGKGEKAQQLLNAQVIGVAEVEGKGKQIKVVVGSGFDTQVHVLQATQILNVITAAEIEQAYAASEQPSTYAAEQTAE